MLREVFDVEYYDFAPYLKAANFIGSHGELVELVKIYKAFRDQDPANIGAADALYIVDNIFGVNDPRTIMQILLEAGYDRDDVVNLHRIVDPFELKNFFASEYGWKVWLAQWFRRGGIFDTPEALAPHLKSLGYDAYEATNALKILGYTPAQVGWFLWRNGYSKDDVIWGVRNAMNVYGFEWQVELAKVLKQMTSCETLGDLPTCHSGGNSFTAADAAELLGKYLYGITIYTCMDTNEVTCLHLYDLLARPDVFGTAKAIEIMLTRFQAGYRLAGIYLMRVSGLTPQQVVDILKKEPIQASADEIAYALRSGLRVEGTPTVMNEIFNALKSYTNDDFETLKALKNGGFSAYEQVLVMTYVLRLEDKLLLLIDVGYSPQEAYKAIMRYVMENQTDGLDAFLQALTKDNFIVDKLYWNTLVLNVYSLFA
jgi:hypothetical protein